MISLKEFLQLPVQDVAQLVRASGQKVIAFPINGTQRWFMLECAKRIVRIPAIRLEY